MSNLKAIAELADKIKAQIKEIASLEKERDRWQKPEQVTFDIGETRYWVVRKDGTTQPLLQGVQREAIKAHDEALFHANSRLQTLLWKMRKQGGAA